MVTLIQSLGTYVSLKVFRKHSKTVALISKIKTNIFLVENFEKKVL